MNKQILKIVFLAGVATLFSACSIVGGIFQAGMGVGIFMAVSIIALILFLVFRLRKRS